MPPKAKTKHRAVRAVKAPKTVAKAPIAKKKPVAKKPVAAPVKPAVKRKKRVSRAEKALAALRALDLNVGRHYEIEDEAGEKIVGELVEPDLLRIWREGRLRSATVNLEAAKIVSAREISRETCYELSHSHLAT